MNKIKLFSKIFIAISISFIISNLASKEIFVENTPMVRRDLALRSQKTFLALIGRKELDPKDKLKDLPLVPISKGVYAKEDNTSRYTVMKLDEMEMVEYTFTVKGKEIKIHIPKDQIPPSQNVLDKL